MSFTVPSGDPGIAPCHTISQELTRPGTDPDATPYPPTVRTASEVLAGTDDGTASPILGHPQRPYSNVFFGSISPKVTELEDER